MPIILAFVALLVAGLLLCAAVAVGRSLGRLEDNAQRHEDTALRFARVSALAVSALIDVAAALLWSAIAGGLVTVAARLEARTR